MPEKEGGMSWTETRLTLLSVLIDLLISYVTVITLYSV